MKHGGGNIGNIMVWGCFSGRGVGPLVRVDGKMDRFQYLGILEQQMLPHAEENMPLLWMFQHDNDLKHTSAIVKQWLRDNQVNVMRWPAQSPDLNPIENIWEELDRRLRQRRKEKFKNQDDLFEELNTVWHSISQNDIDKLIVSMKSRCIEVIKAKGFATR